MLLASISSSFHMSLFRAWTGYICSPSGVLLHAMSKPFEEIGQDISNQEKGVQAKCRSGLRYTTILCGRNFLRNLLRFREGLAPGSRCL